MTKPKPQCQVCSKLRHMIVTCYHRFDHSFLDINSSIPHWSREKGLLGSSSCEKPLDLK